MGAVRGRSWQALERLWQVAGFKEAEDEIQLIALPLIG